MKKFLLFESINGQAVQVIGGLLVSAAKDADTISSVKLLEGLNCIFFVSLDGTKEKLLRIVDIQPKAPFENDGVGPYIYQLKFEKPTKDAM